MLCLSLHQGVLCLNQPFRPLTRVLLFIKLFVQLLDLAGVSVKHMVLTALH